MKSEVKSVSQIRKLIREAEAEIKKLAPMIKSMGSPEARALERLKGKVVAYKEVIVEEPKDESVSISNGEYGVAVGDSDELSKDTRDDPRYALGGEYNCGRDCS